MARTEEEMTEILADACCETSEAEIYEPRYSVGYRNGKGLGGVSWPAVGSLELAKEEMSRRKAEETGAPHGILFWYIQKRWTVAKTQVVLAEAP